MTDRWTTQEKLLLVVICGVVFLDTLDLSLVQVALPSIGSALHLGEGPLQWIVSAFVLGYGGFLLLGGRCADVLGRRRVLLVHQDMSDRVALSRTAGPGWSRSATARSSSTTGMRISTRRSFGRAGASTPTRPTSRPTTGRPSTSISTSCRGGSTRSRC